MAFRGLPATAQPHGVAAHELARDRLVAVVAPAHPLAGEPAVDLRRLSSEVFVDLSAGTAAAPSPTRPSPPPASAATSPSK